MAEEIITLTMNAAVDSCLEADELRESGKTYCRPCGDLPGGGGVNVARAVRLLGGEALAVVLLGGPTGRLLAELLDREGVTHYDIPLDGDVRRTSIVFVPGDHRRFQLVLPGSEVAAAEWLACLHTVEELARDAAYLVLSGSLPPGVPDDFYARVAHHARRAGCRVAVEAPPTALAAALDEGVYLAKPDRHGFDRLVGVATHDAAGRLEAARRYVREGAADIFVATFGAEGSIVAAADESFAVPPPPIQLRSEVGAGASYLGAFILGLSQGRPLRDCAAFASGAAGSALETWGPGLCEPRATERLAALVRTAMDDAGARPAGTEARSGGDAGTSHAR